MKLKSIILLTVLLFTMGCLENYFIYFPKPVDSYETANIDFIEDCVFNCRDKTRLHGWYSPKEGAKSTILWFHGNAGNMNNRLEQFILMRRLLNANIFLFDYRGYGKSAGTPSEKGLYSDALAAYEFLINQKGIAPDTIYLYGQSLGAAVAAHLAHSGAGAGLILEAPFSSLLEIGSDLYPWLPAKFVTKERYDTKSRIGEIKQPILIIHGAEDNLVPLIHAQRLKAASKNAELLILKGAGHSNLYLLEFKEFWEKFEKFIKCADKTKD